jgi:hypothetical protein
MMRRQVSFGQIQVSFGQIIETVGASITDLGARRRLLAEIATLLDSPCATLVVLRRGEVVFGVWHGFPDYPTTFFKNAAVEDQWRKSLIEGKGSMEIGVHFGSSPMRPRS